MAPLEQGYIFVISSPSGGGKTTVIRALKEKGYDLEYSISATTRPKRDGEVDGKDYFFVTEKQFQKHVEQHDFIEYANVYGLNYGTYKSQVDDCLSNGKIIVLDIDVQGALKLKRLYPQAVLVFLLPPSLDVLETRLRNRATDKKDVIEQRLKIAKDELELADQYDFQIINLNIQNTVRQITSIIEACTKGNF